MSTGRMYLAKAAAQHLMNIVLESDRARGTRQALVAMDRAAAAAGTAAATAAGCACDQRASCSCCSGQHGARAPLRASRCMPSLCFQAMESTGRPRTPVPGTGQHWAASGITAYIHAALSCLQHRIQARMPTTHYSMISAACLCNASCASSARWAVFR